jgi:hypothetical protein
VTKHTVAVRRDVPVRERRRHCLPRAEFEINVCVTRYAGRFVRGLVALRTIRSDAL